MTGVVVIVVFFLLGQFRFLDIYGINPNLLLVGLLFFGFKAEQFRFLGVLLAVSALLTLIFTPAWLFQFSVLLFIVLFFYFAKGFMTGTGFFDFLIGIAVGTLFFYLAVSPFRFDLDFYALILWEVPYNLIIGALMWYAAQKVTN